MNDTGRFGHLRRLGMLLFLAVAPAALKAYGLPRLSGSLPDFYLREIAAAAVGAFTVAVVILIQRWRGRMKRLEAQRNELSLAVMLKTWEIRKEKETVVRQKQQIEKLLVKAQASNRAKDEFLANISHEIRTPLHGVIGMTGLTLQSELTSEQREYLDLVESSAKSLLALVNDVLDFSKIEAGGLTLECLPFSVRHCVEEASAGFAIAAAKKNLDFDLTIDASVPEVIDGDALRLRQILANLMSNAVKFTEHGAIRLSVSTDRLRRCASLSGERYRHWHPTGTTRGRIRAVSPGGRFHHPKVRRHRARPHHLHSPGKADGRGTHARKR